MVGDHRDVRIAAKAGSPRPSHRWLRTCLPAAKRAFAPSCSALEQEHPPVAGRRRNEGMNFDPATLCASLDLSCCALKSDRFDLLLLHESYANDTTPAAIGYLHGAPIDLATDAASPLAWRRRRRQGRNGSPTRGRSRRGCAGSTASPCRDASSSTHPSASPKRSPRFGFATGDSISRELLVIFSLGHVGAPDVHLLFASAHPKRLNPFLSVVSPIDRSVATTVFDRLNSQDSWTA